jgi:hypothetical protein
MKHPYKTCAAAFVSLLLVCAVRAADAPSQDQLAEGQRLVQQLRQAVPKTDYSSEIRGTLTISHNGKRQVPVTFKSIAHRGAVENTYESKPSGDIPGERLIIRRAPGGNNEYFYARAASVDAPIPQPQPISQQQLYVPFAQSDFWLADLGIEFIFWPEQARLKGELRLGRDCYVLESINPNNPQIARIKSWIDKESVSEGYAGILVADGYDASGKQVKEFSVHGSGFKKIKGQWVLEKMNMDNSKTGSHTVLKFDLPKE